MDFRKLLNYILENSTELSLFIYLVLIILIIIAIFYIIKLKIKNQNYFNILKKQGQTLKNTVTQSNIRINRKADEFESYRAMVNRNFRKVFSLGELILIDYFRKLLSEPGYEKWNIYGHLNIQGNIYNNYQADFLIVSDKGIYVIESKLWNGLTLIYTDGAPNLFANTQFSNYGRNLGVKATGIQIFNINSKSSGEELEINKYTNPVEQAREYSKILRNKLNVRVRNLVVFQQDNERQIKFNDRNLSYYDVDQYTRITTQNNLLSDLKTLNSGDAIDVEKINSIIQTQFEYEIFLNSSNINQPPWGN